MEILIREIDFKGDAQVLNQAVEIGARSEEVHLYPFGDVHVGSPAFDKKRFKSFINIIAEDPYGWIVGIGDNTNAIHPQDQKRASVDNYSDSLLTGSPHEIRKRLRNICMNEADEFLEMVEPVRDRFLGIVRGNHERELEKRYNIDVHQHIVDELGTVDLGDAGFLNLTINRGTRHTKAHRLYRVFATHGCNAGRTAGAKNNSLARLANIFDADLIIQGHSHTPGHESVVRIGTTVGKNPQLVRREIRALNVGSFTEIYQKGVRDYAEQKLYNPPAKLHYRVDIRAFEGKHNIMHTRFTELLR